MTEILAPAGGEESAYAAINCGANAIYLGLTSFSARSGAENFDFEKLYNILGYAHFMNVKVYVAMNTMVKQSELENFLNTAQRVWNLGADAIIMQDMFLGKFLKEACPEMVLHLSTQSGVCNEYGAMLAKDCGFSRVILARETKLVDIKKIAKIIETEVFIQGALCTCFSGQCYMSSFAGGNSGNRGKCKQPCRKKYSINRKGFEDKAYRLSLSDLSIGENISELINAGVVSFKIEGRMRRPEYVAAAVNYYKAIIDGKKGDLSKLKRTYNRGNYTKGLAFGQDKNFISSSVQGHIGEYVGRIKVENGSYKCETEQKFEQGDGFKILRDGSEVGGGLFGENYNGGVIINSRGRLKNGDKVFITTDVSIADEIVNSKILKKPIKISAQFNIGEVAKINVNGRNYYGEEVLQPALSQPFTIQDFTKCFNKTDKYPFLPQYEALNFDENIFVSVSSLNTLRRQIYQNIFSFYANANRRQINVKFNIPRQDLVKNNKKAVIYDGLNSIMSDIIIVKPQNYSENFDNLKGEKYLYLPPYLSGDDLTEIISKIKFFDGIYCDGYYGLYLAQNLNKSFFAGTGFNLANTAALSKLNVKYVALSKELTYEEIESLCAGNTFYLTAGNLKVMDLIYCPFEKSCKSCDKRAVYQMTDESGRVFTLRRYNTSECRYEVYNCADLLTENSKTGCLYDFSLFKNGAEKLLNLAENGSLKSEFKEYTKGHWQNPIF